MDQKHDSKEYKEFEVLAFLRGRLLVAFEKTQSTGGPRNDLRM
jgi:hypothetical protein